MKRLIRLVLIFGLIGLASGITGISSFSTGSHGTSTVYHSTETSRVVAVFYGAFLLYVAWGIYRRIKTVWMLTFLAIVCCWIYTIIVASGAVAASYPQQSSSDSLIYTLLLSLATAPIAIYWEYRWYKQKDYFYSCEQKGE